MNIISIGASFGVVVWIFQDGHLAGLAGLHPHRLPGADQPGTHAGHPVRTVDRLRGLPALAGSRGVGPTGDNTEAVAVGLQRTGGIITAAALLLIIVVGGFATGGAATIKMLGVGTVVAVAVDAALVRTLLVPATMRLLGKWNWWAPGPLASVYRRFGIRES